MAHSLNYEHARVIFDTRDANRSTVNVRMLTDAERSLISGAGNPWGAVIGGLQGSVAGGIAGAATGPMLGVPWTIGGLAGMAQGGIQGAFTGWNTPQIANMPR